MIIAALGMIMLMFLQRFIWKAMHFTFKCAIICALCSGIYFIITNKVNKKGS